MSKSVFNTAEVLMQLLRTAGDGQTPNIVYVGLYPHSIHQGFTFLRLVSYSTPGHHSEATR